VHRFVVIGGSGKGMNWGVVSSLRLRSSLRDLLGGLAAGTKEVEPPKKESPRENIFDAHTHSLSLLTHRYLSFYHHHHLSLFLLSIECSSSRRSSSSIVIAEPRRGKTDKEGNNNNNKGKRLPKTRELETPQVVRYDRPFPQKEQIVVARKRPFYSSPPFFYQAAF